MIVRKPDQQVLPPALHSNPSIFLAGSIEMGVAEDWQTRVEKEFEACNVTLYNPRRDDWDASWEQKISNDQFRKQVSWELTALQRADRILMYFDPTSKSPISLLELGLYAQSNKMIVVCPDGFWRKGNVDIVCVRYGVKQVPTLEDAIHYLKCDLSL